MMRNLPMLADIERKVLWLATWMIHKANHLRDNGDGLKVGGHQASSASLATIMTALYFLALRPARGDRGGWLDGGGPGDLGLLAITSADRLNAGWIAAQRAREAGLMYASSHVERLLGGVPSHCGIVTVIDGHPATLGWLGSVHGNRTRSLGVEHFGQTGSIAELHRHFGIDTRGIMAAAQAMSSGRPLRNLRSI